MIIHLRNLAPVLTVSNTRWVKRYVTAIASVCGTLGACACSSDGTPSGAVVNAAGGVAVTGGAGSGGTAGTATTSGGSASGGTSGAASTLGGAPAGGAADGGMAGVVAAAGN
ncbi:MAG TPA: hypothetical protein VHM25_24840, partial [Polyangiaceae bacterium]|nr:hypothetical protein [Polyangiaceae bacterium]